MMISSASPTLVKANSKQIEELEISLHYLWEPAEVNFIRAI